MGNHTGCVSAPMEHGEQCNMTSPREYSSSHQSIGSESSVSFSTSSLLPVPSDSEDISDSEEEEQRKPDLKLLFLDVDGVINNPNTAWNADISGRGIEDELLEYIKFIVQSTGCKIVLSTTWRLMDDAKAVLLHSLKTRCDLDVDDVVIGQTPSLKQVGGHRTHEIAEYIRVNSYRYNVVSWCALDDMSLHKYDDFSRQFMAGHFVRTNKRTGLTEEKTVKCIRYLNANDEN